MRTRLMMANLASPTLSGSLGRRSLYPDDLEAILREILLPGEDCRFIPLDDQERNFRARLIVLPWDGGLRRTYLFFYNSAFTDNARWYFLAHEIAHVILHKPILTRLMNLNRVGYPLYFLDEEADFLAQLIFWPILRLYSVMAREGDHREEDVVESRLPS